MGVAAASYPTPFVQNGVADVAIVYGANAPLGQDKTVAESIETYLKGLVTASGGSLTGGEKVTEKEVPLGGEINFTGSSLITLSTPNRVVSGSGKGKIPTLLKEKISWDDGTGSSDYRIEEQIFIGGMTLATSLTDQDYEGVALTNDGILEYRLVFTDAINVSSALDDADPFIVTILGTEFEIENADSSGFRVVTSKEYSIGDGDSVVVDGKTFTVSAIYSGSVVVNGQIISKDTAKKVDGYRVRVDDIGYSETPGASRTILRIGEDISKSYLPGDEYLGEDKDDPTWEWTYLDITAGNGYIGAKYVRSQMTALDDVVYVSGSYILPENFGGVTFEGTTDVSYEDFKISLYDRQRLHNSTWTASTGDGTKSDQDVLIIESVSNDKSAIEIGGVETSTLYLRWSANDGIEGVSGGSLEAYYKDFTEVEPYGRARYSTALLGTGATNNSIDNTNVAKLVVGDTEVSVDVRVSSGILYLNLTDNGAGQSIYVQARGPSNLNRTEGTLEWFGPSATEATSKGVAESTDVSVGSTGFGTKEKDIMTYNGLIIQTPKANAERDQIILSVPNDQVYGIVSVSVGGQVATDELGSLLILDTQVSAHKSKNLIVVGGSCINSAAAALVGGALCGPSFTGATGVGAGQYIIKGYADSTISDKVALLVAGYDAADTAAAAARLRASPALTITGNTEEIGQTA